VPIGLRVQEARNRMFSGGLSGLIAIACLSVGATAGASPAYPALSDGDRVEGERLYQERCSSCHEAGGRGAPPRSAISRHTPEDILDVLTTGFMAAVASFMTEEEKNLLARHLGTRSEPASPSVRDHTTGP
jgi:mono/diheme cytochrome c family protein